MTCASRIAARFLASVGKSAPKKVDKYYKSVKEKNPDYSDQRAWATAWSIYCEHVKPGDKSCHKDSYFPGRKTAGSSGEMSVLFTEGRRLAKPFNRDSIQELEGQTLDIQEEGKEFDIQVNLKVIGHQTSGPLTRAQELAGMRREVRIDVRYPLGADGSIAVSAGQTLAELREIGRRWGYAKVMPTRGNYSPRPHQL